MMNIHCFALLLLLSCTNAQCANPELMCADRSTGSCGAQGTRCNGSFQAIAFYPCCTYGTYCTGPNGSCQYQAWWTPAPTWPTLEPDSRGHCGQQGTRCNGYDNEANLFYPCCAQNLLCTGPNGSCQFVANWTAYPPDWTPPPGFVAKVPAPQPTYSVYSSGSEPNPNFIVLIFVVFGALILGLVF